jgi:prepilin-type processing-associated H-X9-DG protein
MIRKGLTRIDVLIAAAGLVLLAVNLQAFSGIGRERAKREVCLANLRSLVSAWQTYTNDNSGKVPVGDIYYSWSGYCIPTGSANPVPQPAWCEYPHRYPHSMPPSAATNGTTPPVYNGVEILNQPLATWLHAMQEGTMWKYVGDYSIYRCPSAAANQYVTYSMSMSMNTDNRAVPAGAPRVMLINQITKPAERFVFLDVGSFKTGAFWIHYDPAIARWGNTRPERHDVGTTFVFADGHAEYKKWTGFRQTVFDDPTVNIPCDCDLRWMMKVTWGDVPYTCSNPAKNCEY